MRKLPIAVITAMCLLAAALAGCEKTEENPFTEIMPGLSYVDSVVGDGPVVQSDDFVAVHYTGWIYEDGVKTKEFDSSLGRGEPIAFPLGLSKVIQGWDKGLPGMKVGGKRTLLISPEMGYGERGAPPYIPPSSTLMFDVEVVALPVVHTEIIEEGTGPVAELGDNLSVHYTGWLWVEGEKGTLFDSSISRGTPYNFTLGAGMVIPGWDAGMEGLKVGTKARLIIPPVMGYGARGSGQAIPPNSTLCFEVELVEIAGK